MQTKYEFLLAEHQRLVAFDKFWRAGNAKDPVGFPMEMGEGDWAEQLQMFGTDAGEVDARWHPRFISRAGLQRVSNTIKPRTDFPAPQEHVGGKWPGAVWLREGNSHRVGVAVDVLYQLDNLDSVTMYAFSPEDDSLGLDPWRIIDGIDKSTVGAHYFIEGSGSQSIAVHGGSPLYVSEADFVKLQSGRR